jgi:hypothetical protein
MSDVGKTGGNILQPALPSLEFASKKRSGALVIGSRELSLMDVPYLQCS